MMPPPMTGDPEQDRINMENFRRQEDMFYGRGPFGFLSRSRGDIAQRSDPVPLEPIGGFSTPVGIGNLQAGQMGPLNRLGQFINQELDEQNQGEVDEFIGEVGEMANQRFGVDLGAVGQRPMFMAKGGAAFPDLSGDGKITQKDILIGRGVIEKEYGGPVGMQMGGDPMMAAGMPPPQAPPMPMPAPEQPPMPMQDQLDPNIVQSALAQAAGGIGDLDQAQNYEQVMNTMRGDQATVEERRQELAGVVGPGDANQTPESVLTLVQPVMMLANVDQGIGELAQQEMTQPMEGPMAGGIMSTVPEPPMMEAGGTAPVNFNKGGEVRPVEYFSPLNLNRIAGGGNQFSFNPAFPYIPTGESPVNLLRVTGLLGQSGDEDAENKVNNALNAESKNPGTGKNRLNQLFESQLDLYRKVGLGDAAERQAMAEQQKRMTKAQMLFDIATAALAFAAPMEGERPGLSPAERLAMAARSTQLPEKIGARAQAQLQLEKEAAKEERAIELAALQSAETKLAAEQARADALELAKLKQKTKTTKPMVYETPEGAKKYFDGNTELDVYTALQGTQGGSIYDVGVKSTTAATTDFKTVVGADGQAIGSFDTKNPKSNELLMKILGQGPLGTGDEAYVKGAYIGTPKDKKNKFVSLTNPKNEVYGGIPAKGTSRLFDLLNKEDKKEFDELQKKSPELVATTLPSGIQPDPGITESLFFRTFKMKPKEFEALGDDDKRQLRDLDVVTRRDFFLQFKMFPEEFEKLSETDQKIKLGLSVITDEMYFNKFGTDREGFLAYPAEVQNRLLKVTPTPVIQKDDKGQLVNVTDPDNPKVIWSVTAPVKPDLVRVTINGVEHIVDKNSEEFGPLIDRMNAANKQQSGSATVTTITGESTPLAFYVEKGDDKGIVVSYDNGKSFVNKKGEKVEMPAGAVPISKETTFNVIKSERSKKQASKNLEDINKTIISSLSGQNFDGQPVNGVDFGTGAFVTSLEDIVAVKDAFAQAKLGTGAYSKLTAFIDGITSLIPPVIKPKFIEDFGTETQNARQFVRGLTVLGRSSLVVNNKFPVAEMANVAQLFPNPDAFFVDPESEARKLVTLKKLAIQQYIRNNKLLEEGGLEDSQRSDLSGNNLEIQRLLSLLESVQIGDVQDITVKPEDLQRAQDLIKKGLNK